MEHYLKNFKNCLQKEVPYCQGECPFHIDILDFIEKIKRGGFSAAFKTYRNAVGFPDIISRLCPAPCEAVCPLGKKNGAIDLLLLEKATIENSKNIESTAYNLPLKNKKIAVVGAGLSGLSCALRLTMKKYRVVIFERQPRIGGRLWELLPPQIFLDDIKRQFKQEEYELRLNTNVESLEALAAEGFDAVFVATGKGGDDFDLLSQGHSGNFCKTIKNTGCFAGGSLLRNSLMDAAAEGLAMGTAIDNFLKTGNLIYPISSNSTAMRLDPAKLTNHLPLRPKNGHAYTEEEAISEAARCIECQCDACRIHCDLTDFYNKWPLRIRDEVQATILPGSAEVKATPAKRLISTCSQCGLCKEVCPEAIDLGGLILEGRRSMHRQEKMPWVFHEFWLRDMAFTNSPKCAISMPPPGSNAGNCQYLFFPGCQLCASEPKLVENTYAWMLEKEPGTGLLLQCCGIPEEWAGREAEHQAALADLKTKWKALGQPVMIMACPTCLKKFQEWLPEIPAVFVYEILEKWDIHKYVTANKAEITAIAEDFLGKSEACSIFDPCSTRQMPETRKSVRRLAADCGLDPHPLPLQEEHSACCSFGGQPQIANPEYAKHVVEKRLSESPNPYLTYCINCRDAFRWEGRQSLHLLELLFGTYLGGGKGRRISHTMADMSPSQRRQNRMELKASVLKHFWNIEEDTEKIMTDITLIISDELKEMLSKKRLLEEDILRVVDFCERNNRRVWNRETNNYSGYLEIGYMTYWVEYAETQKPRILRLVNAYSHRMKIELEAVWNGTKTKLDLR